MRRSEGRRRSAQGAARTSGGAEKIAPRSVVRDGKSAQGAARASGGAEKIAPRSVVRDGRRGSAVVEAALLMPWIAFLFVGILDFGFYSYAAIATQNAARAVAIQSANGSAADVCAAAKSELGLLPNVVGMGACAATQSAVTNSTPLWVCVAVLDSTSGANAAQCPPIPAANCADCAGSGASSTNPSSVQAVVTYRTVPLVPIPGILMGQMQLTRIAEARVIG